MSNKLCKSFHYDFVVSLDSNHDLLPSILNFINSNQNKQILATTYNHRLYNIHQKNFIKGSIDFLDIDHLMFSIKPTSINLIDKISISEKIKYRYFTQLIFVLHSMGRYDIPVGLVSKKLLKTNNNSKIDAIELCSIIENYLIELKSLILAVDININFEKEFCSLNSVIKIKNKLFNKELLFLESLKFDNSEFVIENFVFESQISELEKDIFWIGFDNKFKEVPWKKEYPATKWNTLIENSFEGEGLYEKNIRYCSRCCLPETMEGIEFDEFGICTPCRSSEEKMHINWEEKEKDLSNIFDLNRSNIYYDCMLPMSGGKDSTFQAHILTKKYNLTPLAVTHGPNWLSLSGRYNLENCLQKFNLDHIIFNSKRSIVNKAAQKSISAIGDVCWHCHIGAGTFVIQTALHWDLQLMIWGESIAERDGRGSYINQTEASLYYNLEISGKVKAEDYIDDNLTDKDLSKWFYPEKKSLENSKIRYLHLGNYMFWDEEKQVEFIVNNYEWMNSRVENSFKGYKSTECVMAGLHDYSNFIKRGIGRGTVQASDDIRRGLLTREEGIELAKKHDTQRPHALDFYLEITGHTEQEFESILIDARNLSNYANKLNNLEK
jgi:N-acetyl sugar amidotransferase